MSYLTLSVAKQGEYWSLPKVLIPENTESAYECQPSHKNWSCNRYLSASVSWQSVVPKTLERPFNGSLFVVSMRPC